MGSEVSPCLFFCFGRLEIFEFLFLAFSLGLSRSSTLQSILTSLGPLRPA